MFPLESARDMNEQAQEIDDLSSDTLLDQEGKYLTFRLGFEEFGLELLKVREIIALMEITAVPMTPDHVRGVLNLRGRVIPVVDLRLKFGMPFLEDHDRKCIIVVDTVRGGRQVQMSILVDSVSEVLHIPGKDIRRPPPVGTQSQFIRGIGEVRGGIRILLDIDAVLVASDGTINLATSDGDVAAQGG